MLNSAIKLIINFVKLSHLNGSRIKILPLSIYSSMFLPQGYGKSGFLVTISFSLIVIKLFISFSLIVVKSSWSWCEECVDDISGERVYLVELSDEKSVTF